LIKQSVFIGLILFAPLVWSDSDLSIEEEKESAKVELAELKNKIKQLQSHLSGKQKQQSNAIKNLRSAEKKIAIASKILKSTNNQIKRKERQLSKLKTQQKNLNKDKNKQTKILEEQLRNIYINGKQEYLQLLLNQQDPEKLGRMLVYYDYMNKARQKQVNQLQQTLKELKTIDLAIQNDIKELALLKRSKQSETKQLLALKSKRQKLINDLAKEINSTNDQLTELEINAQELQQLIDSVQETIEEMDFSQPLEGLKQLRGKLAWPAKGKQLKSFGRSYQGQKANGILIAGKEGTEINAIHHGRIVYADWLRGFGLLLIIDHGEGYMSLYGYNQALYKDIGDWVEAGEAVSTLGQSGGQKQPALYFELRHQGSPVNPSKWLIN